jgi:hypothetical protein
MLYGQCRSSSLRMSGAIAGLGAGVGSPGCSLQGALPPTWAPGARKRAWQRLWSEGLVSGARL